MLRHRITIEASLDVVAAALNRTNSITASTADSLRTVQIGGAVGNLRQLGHLCEIDLFDEDGGHEIERLVEVLRAAGFNVEYVAHGSQ